MPFFRFYAKQAGFRNGRTVLVLADYITGMLPCYIFLGGISVAYGIVNALLLFEAVIILLCGYLFMRIRKGLNYFANQD